MKRARDHRRITGARTLAAAAVVCVLVLAAACGAHPSALRGATALSPGTFRTISSGVAVIRTFACDGHALARGTGFLVGDTVAMTTRSMLTGACVGRVTVNGHTILARSWATLAAHGVSEPATDLFAAAAIVRRPVHRHVAARSTSQRSAL